MIPPTTARSLSPLDDRSRGRELPMAVLPPPSTRGSWNHGARAWQAVVRTWGMLPLSRPAQHVREAVRAAEPGQITLDLMRLCRAQGITPAEILREIPRAVADPSLARQRRTVLRGLARRGWDSYELAEIFPLTPAAIRQLVRRGL